MQVGTASKVLLVQSTITLVLLAILLAIYIYTAFIESGDEYSGVPVEPITVTETKTEYITSTKTVTTTVTVAEAGDMVETDTGVTETPGDETTNTTQDEVTLAVVSAMIYKDVDRYDLDSDGNTSEFVFVLEITVYN